MFAAFHVALTGLAVALAVLGLALGLARSARNQGPDRLLLVVLAGSAAAVTLNGLVGLGLVGGGGPADPLHLLYGIAAVLAVPVGVGLGVGRPARRQSLVLTLSAVVLLGLLLRLAQTGG